MSLTPTSLAEEADAQRVWQERLKFPKLPMFQTMVRNEFASQDSLRAAQDRRLKAIVAFAEKHVPYYRRVFKRQGLSIEDFRGVDDLHRVPILKKADVMSHEKEMLSDTADSRPCVWWRSSGTTGRPCSVCMTTSSACMFGVLEQRNCRWYRWRPWEIHAWIRGPGQMPKFFDESTLADGKSMKAAAWRNVGDFFKTGPFIGFSATNPVEDQLTWLRKMRPAYLTTYPRIAEAYCYACPDGVITDSLRGILTVASTLTEGVRCRIENTFGIPVNESYGLTETGLVANRCAAGRFHVHAEHCHVEILDEDAQPCAHGRAGHVIVTVLDNQAMPLIRYDSGDLAEAVSGPCPCGRTLPSFRRLIGRYFPNMSAETSKRYFGAMAILEAIPNELMRPIRMTQLHQFRDNSFELRVAAVAAPNPGFNKTVTDRWREMFGDTTPLRITVVDSIPVPPSGKIQEFTSDLA